MVLSKHSKIWIGVLGIVFCGVLVYTNYQTLEQLITDITSNQQSCSGPNQSSEFQNDAGPTVAQSNVKYPCPAVASATVVADVPTISWKSQVRGTGVRYDVYRALLGQSFTMIGETSNTNFVSSAVVADKSYRYLIITVDSNGTGSKASNIVSFP